MKPNNCENEKDFVVTLYLHLIKMFLQSRLKIVNHIDEDPLNNDSGNLEWCNDKYNLNYATAQQLDLDGNIVAKFVSLNDASRTLNLSLTQLWKSCNNGRPFNGYYWRYVDTQSEVKNA